MARPGWLVAGAVGVALGALVGAAGGWWLAPDLAGESAPARDVAVSQASKPDSPDDGLLQLDVLRLRLEEEVARRKALERRLAERGHEAVPVPSAGEEAEPQVGDDWIDADVLARGGFTTSEIQDLRARFEAIELEKLYLRDQATREGWNSKPRYARQMRELDARYGALREVFGDEAYDWILYASGRKNRVVVQRVMEASEAAGVGFEAGDVFLRYDDQRVFDPQALQRATNDGEAGRTVQVEVLREGEVVHLYPARGPLGIALLTQRSEPVRPRY